MAYNVLIVDDSAIVRKVLMKTFSITDIPVNQFYQAENGQVGLDILKDNWIDVIFLDINMPVMNGMEFISKLRAEPSPVVFPVLEVPTEGSTEQKEELAAHNMKANLRKPVTPDVLVDAIPKSF